MGDLVANYERRLRLAGGRLPNRVKVDVRRASPVVTGEMRDSLRVSGGFTAGVIRVVVSSDVIQTLTTNFGARAHPIVAHDREGGRKGYLRFKGRGGGFVYRHEVWHPGNVGTRWLPRVLDRWPAMIRDELARS